MNRLSIAVVALIMLTAGCSTSPNSGSPEGTPETVTAAPVPTTTGETPSVGRIAPGIAPSGIVDALTVSKAHKRALDRRAYRREAKLTIRNENGELVSRQTFLTHVAANHSVKRTVIRVGGPNAPYFGEDESTTIWQIGSARYQVVDHPNGTRYRELQPWESIQPSLIAPPGTAIFLIASIFETNASNGSAGGPLTIAGDRLRSPALLAAAAGVRNPRNASLRAEVRPDGFARSYRLAFSASGGNQPIRYSVSVRYTKVGRQAADPPPPPSNMTG